MALFPDPFSNLLGLQNALESFRRSDWLQSGPSAGGSYPPLNVFRKGDDLILIAEVPGISKSDLKAWKDENQGKMPGIEFAGIIDDYHIMDGAEGGVVTP